MFTRRRLFTIVLIALIIQLPTKTDKAESSATMRAEPLRCIAFSHYVQGYNAEFGPHPPPALIDALLDSAITQTGFRCIMTYGLLNGLDHVFEAAENRGVKVIAVTWLTTATVTNTASIALGIQKAKEYPDTIIRISCGPEMRNRYGVTIATPIVQNCLQQYRAEGVTQTLTSIDTWWNWCNESSPCQSWSLSNELDWIGINVYPWWENKYSGLYPCTSAAEAADFHTARLQELIARYPGKEIILTEFGWPAGPNGYRETNIHTGQQCGVASAANQYLVLESTLTKLDELGLPAVLFEAFREPWKARLEGQVGPYWGVCLGTVPYACLFPYGLRQRIHMPILLADYHAQ